MLAAAVALALCAASAGADGGVDGGVDPAFERATDAFDKQLALVPGPTSADLGRATLAVPAGDVVTGVDGARTWLKLTHNAESGAEVALVGLPGGARVLFERAASGYIDDEGADEVSALGARPAAEVLGKSAAAWDRAPAYDATKRALSWCARQTSGAVACSARLLGRRGYVAVTALVPASPDIDRDVERARTELAALLAGFAWKPGESYADHARGDRTAPFSLAALVAGGPPAPPPPLRRGRFLGGAAAGLLAIVLVVAVRRRR